MLAPLALAAAPQLCPALDSSQCRSMESCHLLSGIRISVARYNNNTCIVCVVYIIHGCAQYTKVRVNVMYRSLEYLLPPVTVQDIVSPRRKKNEHTPDNLRGKCPMIVSVFFLQSRLDLERCAAHKL